MDYKCPYNRNREFSLELLKRRGGVRDTLVIQKRSKVVKSDKAQLATFNKKVPTHYGPLLQPPLYANLSPKALIAAA